MGNLLGAPITDKETHVGESEGFQFGLSSMQGWRVHMEDAHIAECAMHYLSGEEKVTVPGHSIFAVFDGHGGTYAANYSGKNFCRVLSKQAQWTEYAKLLSKEPRTNEKEKVEWSRQALECLEKALKEAFVELDQEIGLAMQGKPHVDANKPYNESSAQSQGKDDEEMQPETAAAVTDEKSSSNLDPILQAATDHARSIMNDDDAGDDSGTTACIVLVTPEHFVCANAGDSRAVYSKNNHKAIPLSYDHKPDDEEEERRIRAAGGYVAGGRVEGDLAVSRGLGDFRFKHYPTVLAGNFSNNKPQNQKVSPVPDIIVQTRNSAQDEFIIVACDGIWDVRTNQDCVNDVATIFEEGESNLGLLSEEILDQCLQFGSKDNMTALVVKFPSQKIVDGGGVLKRREEREKDQQQNPGSDEPS
jgi:serine/threonine protein phosphatase PrpC